MKKFMGILLCFVATVSLFSGCGSNNSYVGDYYSKTAKDMNAETILSIYDTGVFEIEYLFPDGSSTLINGEYTEVNEKELSFQPKTKFIVMNDVPAEMSMENEPATKVVIKGDYIIFGEGENSEEIFIREGSKTAQTDTTVQVTTKATE